ncbi:MAG: hypothetical protein Q8P26_01130 [Candidatus Levybacteria bacterium]|nr:hypothetical protein [Candidatus Levybacteria bacterium]
MDDKTKIMSQNGGVVNQGGQAQAQPQPVQKPADKPISSPVSAPNKEIGPVSVNSSRVNEVSPAGPEVSHEVSQELKDIGVEEKKDRPNLTDDHKQMGINHAGASVPVATVPTRDVKLPMSEEEVAGKLKSGENDDSGKWLAGLINKVIAVMGLK